MARPSSASNASRLATSTTLIPDAAICRANSFPIPDEAPVTSAQGPNLSLLSAALIFLLPLCLLTIAIRPSRRGISPEPQMPFIRSPRHSGLMSVDSLTAVRIFARPASGFAVWACGFSPPGVSQALNPTLEALGLRRHKTGVMKGMSQDRNALHGGKQVHGKAVGVFPLPECPNLALDPGHVLSG